MNPKRAQASVEYLILFAVISAIIAPATYIVYSSLHSTDLEISAQAIKNIGLEMISKAEELYYLPPPAKISYTKEFPIGIKYVYNKSEEGWKVIDFILEGDVEVPLITKVPIKIYEENITEGTKTITMYTNRTGEFVVYIDIS